MAMPLLTGQMPFCCGLAVRSFCEGLLWEFGVATNDWHLLLVAFCRILLEAASVNSVRVH